MQHDSVFDSNIFINVFDFINIQEKSRTNHPTLKKYK